MITKMVALIAVTISPKNKRPKTFFNTHTAICYFVERNYNDDKKR